MNEIIDYLGFHLNVNFINNRLGDGYRIWLFVWKFYI